MKGQSSLGAVIILSALLCVTFSSPVPDIADCHEGHIALPPSPPSNILPGADNGSRELSKLTPDYLEGPWMLLGKEHPFQAWTKRPRMLKIMSLLGSVADTLLESDATANATRNAILPEEQAVIQEVTKTVENLKAEILMIDEKRQAFESIQPTQTEISDKIDLILSPKLQEISRLYQTSADIRFPFAERLAAFTDDLLKILRTKLESQVRLKGFVSQSNLRESMDRYDKMSSEAQKKLDAEIAAASLVLNPISSGILNARNLIDQTEREIKDLREQLEHFMAVGGSYTHGESEVKQITLNTEQQLVDAVTHAGQEEDRLIAYNAEHQAQLLSLIHHTAVLSGALMHNDETDQPATQSLQATQTLTPLD